jgi:hypothetical protein
LSNKLIHGANFYAWIWSFTSSLGQGLNEKETNGLYEKQSERESECVRERRKLRKQLRQWHIEKKLLIAMTVKVG